MTAPHLDLRSLPGIETLDLLTQAGHQAYVVGGPVRNGLLGLPIDDLDIATDATPDRVLQIAAKAGWKAVPTGVDHGTVTLLPQGVPVEVTTFRKDVATDGRRAVVAFSKDLTEDAKRRDFTMNALYADASGAVLDPLGGLPDLHARRVRFIGLPEDRIREDYLRILRFFRFHAWYGDATDGIDPDGLAACAALTDGLAQLSKERIGAEMLKLMAAPDPAPSVASMAQTGVLGAILPGADATALALLVHLEQGLGVSAAPLRRLASLGDLNLESDLRLSKKQITEIHNMRSYLSLGLSAAEFGYRNGFSAARDAILLRAAALGQSVDPDDLAQARNGAAAVFPLKAADLPHLSGPALGKALKAAETAWIASGFSLSKQALIDKSR